MRSPFAYIPRRGPLQSARPGAAVAYLGALVVVAFLYSNPAVLVAAGDVGERRSHLDPERSGSGAAAAASLATA